MINFSQNDAFQLQAALPALPVYSSPQQQFYTPSSSRSKRTNAESNAIVAPMAKGISDPSLTPELPDKLRTYLERQLWPSASSPDTMSIVTAQAGC